MKQGKKMKKIFLGTLLVFAANIIFAQFTPIPLDKLCNRELVDNTPESDGKGGWTDQGKDNSLSGFPTGKVEFESIPFLIPEKGNAGIMFSGKKLQHLNLLSEVSIDIPKNAKGPSIYLLAVSVWGSPEGKEAAKVIANFANGESEEFSIKYEEHVSNFWWDKKERPKSVVAWSGKNGMGVDICVYLIPLTPKYVTGTSPSKITIKADTSNDASFVLLGLTTGTKTAKEILPPPLSWKDWEDNGTEGWFTISNKYDDAKVPAPWEESFEIFKNPAGSLGWTITKGENFEFEKAPGKPVRFKGITICGAGFHPFQSQAEQYAKILRKFGFNQVRYHSIFDVLLEEKGGFKIPEYNKSRLDKFDKYFAELKKQGIYVRASALFSTRWSAELGVKDAEKIPTLNNVQYTFDEKHQELYLKALKAFLEHKNPYTGLRYADDPAFHMFKIVNESSLFFNSATGLPGYYALKFQDKYNQWLKNKYGNHIKLHDNWQVEGQVSPLAASESLDKGTIAILAHYELATMPGKYKKRAQDQTKFFYETEYNWFKKVRDLVISTGSKALVQGSSWGGPGYLQEIQSAVNAQFDFHGKHTYWLHPHGGWTPEVALFPNKPIVYHPLENMLLCAYQHVSGLPFVITEWNFCYPNDYTLDAAPFMAIYGALQNIAANNRFVADLPEFGSRKNNFFSMFNSPSGIATEPISYYIYVRGDVQQAPLIYTNSIAGEKLHDPSRAEKKRKTAESENRFYMKFGGQDVPIETMLVGSVRLTLDEKKYPPLWKQDIFEKNFDEKNKIIKSATGEVEWDYGKGQIRVNSPKTRLVLGFLGSENQFGSLKIKTSKAYGLVGLSSIDNVPLEESSKILLTVSGRDRNSGQLLQYLQRNGKIVDKYESFCMKKVGGPPLIYEPIEVELSLKNSKDGDWKLIPLDLSGRPRTEKITDVKVSGGVLSAKISNKDYEALNFVLQK